MKTSLLLFILLFVPGALCANGREVKDTLSNTYCDKTIQFRAQQLILPASLILVGSWGVSNGFLQSLNHSVKDQMTDLRKNRFFHADDYIQYLPVISYAGLGLIEEESTFVQRKAYHYSHLLSGNGNNGERNKTSHRRETTGFLCRKFFSFGTYRHSLYGCRIGPYRIRSGIWNQCVPHSQQRGSFTSLQQ